MMAGARLYAVLSRLLDVTVWGGQLEGIWNLPDSGPAVFVANHAGALGPIAVTSALPMRVYPWVVGQMLDWQAAAAYLRKDFVEPVLHVPPGLSLQAARMLSQLSVRLLRTIECIPVWEGRGLMDTYRLSIEALERGRNLLILPEDPTLLMDEQLQMRPFKTGFAKLGEIFHAHTRQRLRFFPLGVLPRKRLVRVGAAVIFNPMNRPADERRRIAGRLEAAIRAFVAGSTLEAYTGVPLPH